jgi:hypothetical protein
MDVMSDMLRAETEKPQSSLDLSLAELKQQIEMLDKSIVVLGEHLTEIRTDETEKDDVPAPQLTIPGVGSSPLVRKINIIGEHIAGLRNKVDLYIRELEI